MSILDMASAFARGRPARPAAPPTLARFSAEIRPAIARVAERDARLRDLAASFPALLHRFAVEPRSARSARAAAIVREGGSLKAAALAAEMPLWVRRLPPEAFGAASPDLPGGAIFSIRVANVLPRSRSVAAAWLAAVAEAARWGDDGAALWAARECAAPEGLTAEEARLVALHSWFARRPATRGGALAGGRWSSMIGREAALERSRRWLERIDGFLALGAERAAPWLDGGVADGFEFVAVADEGALDEEATAMRNCVRDYAWAIARDCERVFSVRRGGERVATLSVYFPEDAPFPQFEQLKGPENAPAPPEVWFAARSWLVSQAPERPQIKPWGGDMRDPGRWSAVWRPWWLARRRFPAELPLRPSGVAFHALYGFRPYRRPRRRRLRRA